MRAILLLILTIPLASCSSQHQETLPCGNQPPPGPPHEECFTWPMLDAGMQSGSSGAGGSDAGSGAGGGDAGSRGGDGGVPACPAENDAASILEQQMFDGQVSVKTPGVLGGGKCCYTVTRQQFVGC